MPNEFNGNDVPAPEKSKKRKTSTPKARKSASVASDGAAATPAPAKKASPRKSTPKVAEPAAPEVQVAEVVVTNVSTMRTPSTNNLHERIRARAYEIYVQRGGQHGFDQADWLRAEAEILGKLTA